MMMVPPCLLTLQGQYSSTGLIITQQHSDAAYAQVRLLLASAAARLLPAAVHHG
jgi:hypothetical protein